ncbi:MAG: hypothetical protein GTN62_00960 [Gemmatimonadales bacterium]|nr:hypothetical protein [Gemmatimonadales bacterium]NIN48673.1 hypothetical protein [Gemmatimonadales bacterium]NIP06137.1 hypothetical protein [Gemmatimonadales bacterium]NIR01311.1 hypothetical protein [Gemmatimonadales bacterium]
MRRSLGRAATALGALVMLAVPLHAQGYHVRLDTRFQSVAFRGFTLANVFAADVDTAADGSLTANGFAVRCPPRGTSCSYFRPGEVLRGSPLVSTVDAAFWSLGVPGLTFRGKARVGFDLSDDRIIGGDTLNVWPGADPEVQLIEGYAEYANRYLTVQAGRTHVVSRLGFTGFDGGKVDIRSFGGRLRLSAFGGWGLYRGGVLPITSPAVSPLGEFRPTDRQIVAGGSVGWRMPGFEGRVLYQREVDPRGDLETVLYSERGAADFTLRPMRGVTLIGGAYYDFGVGELGTADAAISYAELQGRWQASAGWRRYRPFFELWTIWNVFSPISYNAGFASAMVTPIRGLQLWTRGEVIAYEDTAADTNLVVVEDDGWRWSWGGTLTRLPGWTLSGGYHVQQGVGASSRGFNARATFEPRRDLTVSAHGGFLDRPLEYRFADAEVWTYGLRIDFEPTSGVRLNAEAYRWDETRERDDAAQIDWDFVRVNVGLTLLFGSGADRPRLHPAILRIPERRRPR